MAPRSSIYRRLRLEDYLAVAGIFLAVLVVLAVLNRGGTASRSSMSCDPKPQLAVHYHAHVTLVENGRIVPIPAGVGVTRGCRFWLHTNSADGVVHVEAPALAARREFTVGDFFGVWGQPLTSRQVAGMKLGRGEQLKVWADGRPFTGEVAKLALGPNDQVVLEVGSLFVSPPRFDWTSPPARHEIARVI